MLHVFLVLPPITLLWSHRLWVCKGDKTLSKHSCKEELAALLSTQVQYTLLKNC